MFRRASRSEVRRKTLSRDSDNDECPQFSHEAFRELHGGASGYSATVGLGSIASGSNRQQVRPSPLRYSGYTCTMRVRNASSFTSSRDEPSATCQVTVNSDWSSTPIQVLDYFPYGSTSVSHSGFNEQKQFIGQYQDPETNINYLQARYENPNTGQFLSEDPVFLALADPGKLERLTQQDQQNFLADPQQMNSYSYGRDNPMTTSDPKGLASMFSKDPLLATPELYGYVSLLGDANAYFSKGPKTPATQNSQKAQLQLDAVVDAAVVLATETEEGCLTVAGTVLQGVDAYCSGHTCKDFSDSQNTTPGAILVSLRPSAGSVASPYGLSNVTVSTNIAQGSPQTHGQAGAQFISNLQSFVSALSAYVAGLSSKTKTWEALATCCSCCCCVCCLALSSLGEVGPLLLF
jgi:RHS repeat-associated protein